MFAKIFAPLALLSLAAAAPAPVAGPSSSQLEKKAGDFWGQATYYDTTTNAGACGWWNQPSEWVVAMNSPQYGENGYGGHCGNSIWICNNDNGQCASAKVVDECPTCSWGSLDLSEGLFGHLTNGNYDQGVFTLHWGYN